MFEYASHIYQWYTHTHTHTLHVQYSNVRPGDRTGYQESPDKSILTKELYTCKLNKHLNEEHSYKYMLGCRMKFRLTFSFCSFTISFLSQKPKTCECNIATSNLNQAGFEQIDPTKTRILHYFFQSHSSTSNHSYRVNYNLWNTPNWKPYTYSHFVTHIGVTWIWKTQMITLYTDMRTTPENKQWYNKYPHDSLIFLMTS